MPNWESVMVDLLPEHLRLVKELLSRYVPGREVRVFGSRVNGSAKPASDLDIAVMGELALPRTAIAELKFAFSSSNLPFMVDVVSWADTSEEFRRIIAKQSEVIQPGGK